MHLLAFVLWDSLAAHQLQSVNLFDDLLSLFRILPLFVPIDSGPVRTFRWLGGSLQYEFCDVLAGRAVDAATREVLDDVLAIIANRTEVESIAACIEISFATNDLEAALLTWIERKNHVELLDKDR